MVPIIDLSDESIQVTESYFEAAQLIAYKLGLKKTGTNLSTIVQWLVFFQQNLGLLGKSPLDILGTSPLEGEEDLIIKEKHE